MGHSITWWNPIWRRIVIFLYFLITTSKANMYQPLHPKYEYIVLQLLNTNTKCYFWSPHKNNNVIEGAVWSFLTLKKHLFMQKVKCHILISKLLREGASKNDIYSWFYVHKLNQQGVLKSEKWVDVDYRWSLSRPAKKGVCKGQ